MKHGSDIVAIASFVAGGGLASLFAGIGIIWPKYHDTANGIAIALVAVAGLVRTLYNPTPPAGTASAVVQSSNNTPVVITKGA